MHCWKDYRTHLEETGQIYSKEWADTYESGNKTCLLENGHSGEQASMSLLMIGQLRSSSKIPRLTMSLSPKQVRIYEFIRRYFESNKEAPTIAEIGRQFQMRSSASVHKVLTVLEREGKIQRVPNVSRGIRLIEGDGDQN